MKKIRFTLKDGANCSFRDPKNVIRVVHNGALVAEDQIKHPKPEAFIKAGLAVVASQKQEKTKEVK